MKTGILFDLDGTLLDTLEDLTDSVNYTLEKYGYPTRTLEQIRQAVSNGARNLTANSMAGQADDATVDRALADYQVHYATHCQDKTRPYEGVLQALEVLKSRCPVGIVSNKPDSAVKALCADYFPGLYALGETPDCPRKPAADMVYKGMKAIGADRCIYVGDSEVDVLTAKNAEVPCLCVLWGFRDKEDMLAAGGTHFCEAPQKLVEKIEELIHGK